MKRTLTYAGPGLVGSIRFYDGDEKLSEAFARALEASPEFTSVSLTEESEPRPVDWTP